MQLIKVAAAALNQTPLDWDGNLANIVGAIERARGQGATLLCLPEMCISGYGCEDAFQSAGIQRTALGVLSEIAPHTHGMIVSVGLPMLQGSGLFNAACLLIDGRIVGFVCKQHLAGEGIHYEPRWFTPWPAGLRAEANVDGRTYPIGDVVFDCGGVKIGFEICQDAWVAERPGGELARQGVDIILNPSASHFAFGKQEVRRRFVLEGSRAYSVSYILANLLGNEAGRAIYDGGTLIASAGQMLAQGPRFSMADFTVCSAVVDVEATRMNRAKAGAAPDALAERIEPVACPVAYPEIAPQPSVGPLTGWEVGSSVKEEEFARAVSLGLFDYLRKSRSHGFVVSISGGADSAAVATLSALAVRFGTAELGIRRFAQKIGYVDGAAEAADPRQLIGRLLSCVYQSTRNSSDTTRNAAAELADALGADFLQFDVDRIVEDYVALAARGIGRELTWERDDLALQNIQARARAPGVWLLANLRGALLLATSNRSEAAVGYATMDGDTCGGLSPIAGIDKAFLRQWLRWMETTGPDGLGNLPILHLINAQQPTAELRPPAAGQTDEDDLMPYEVLDVIERAAIRDKLVPIDVLRLIEAQFGQFDRKQLAGWVVRFFTLWTRNQWKRERYAPSFHLDDENLDPKTWCRFPILSGGFARELREMTEALEREVDG